MLFPAIPGFLFALWRRDGARTFVRNGWRAFSIQSWRRAFDCIRKMRILRASGLVDAAWYRREYPEVAEKSLDPVLDFLTPPHERMRMPNPDFVPLEYESLHYDVRQCDVPAAVHYARDGMREGRAVSTLERAERPFPAGAVELRRSFAPAPVRRRRTAVFAAFGGDARSGAAGLYYLRGLREVADNVVFIANSPVFPDEVTKLDGLVRLAVFRHHGCYDFGSYKAGWSEATALGLLDPGVCDELILCNDSCLGPVFPFSESFEEMARRNREAPADERFDFWGMTAHELFGRPHVQSYFYVFGRPVLESGDLERFLHGLEPYRERGQIVYFCETRLTGALVGSGHRFSSLVPLSFFREKKSSPVKFPVTLLSRYRMPLFKRKTLGGESKESLSDALRIVRAANPELAALMPEPSAGTSFDATPSRDSCAVVRAARRRHEAALLETEAAVRAARKEGRSMRVLFLTTAAEPFRGGEVLRALCGRCAVDARVAAIPDFRLEDAAECRSLLDETHRVLLSRFGPEAVVRAAQDAFGGWSDLVSDADVVCYETAEDASDFRYNPRYAVGRPFLPVLFFDRRTAGPYPLEKEFARQNYAYFWKILFSDRATFDQYARHGVRRGKNGVLVESNERPDGFLDELFRE